MTTMEESLSTFMSDDLSAFTSDQTGFQMSDNYSTYPDPDGLSQSFLPDSSMGYSFKDLFDLQAGFPRSSNDDINQFFDDSAFINLTSSPGPSGEDQPLSVINAQEITPLQQIAPFRQSPNDLIKSSSMESWSVASQTGVSLSVVTSGLSNEDSRNTTVQHGQITPGDSPASPENLDGENKDGDGARTRRTSKCNSEDIQTQNNSPLPPPVKRTRKPRKSTKKQITPEEEANKREVFLKRNREAAHKCRIKKKSQNEHIMDKVKELDADNALKSLQVEELKREISSLKALLLPHYRECNDQQLIAVMDASSLNWNPETLRMMEKASSLRNNINDNFSVEEITQESIEDGKRRTWSSASGNSGSADEDFDSEIIFDASVSISEDPTDQCFS